MSLIHSRVVLLRSSLVTLTASAPFSGAIRALYYVRCSLVYLGACLTRSTDTGGADRSVRAWDVHRGTQVASLSVSRVEVTALAASALLPDSVVSADRSGAFLTPCVARLRTVPQASLCCGSTRRRRRLSVRPSGRRRPAWRCRRRRRRSAWWATKAARSPSSTCSRASSSPASTATPPTYSACSLRPSPPPPRPSRARGQANSPRRRATAASGSGRAAAWRACAHRC